MKLRLAALIAAAALAASSAGVFADASAPTNGGSANGAGQSGSCTGANADRPAACHNGNGAGN